MHLYVLLNIQHKRPDNEKHGLYKPQFQRDLLCLNLVEKNNCIHFKIDTTKSPVLKTFDKFVPLIVLSS